MQYPIKALKEMLSSLAIELTHDCSNINSGGCGIVAAMVGKQIKKLGVDVEVITPTKAAWREKGNTPSIARKNVSNKNDPREWDDNGLCRAHLVLRFKLGKSFYTWDSDGLSIGGRTFGADRDYVCAYPFGQGLTIEETEMMCIPQKGWNSSFDRRIVPEMEHVVYNTFTEFKEMYA